MNNYPQFIQVEDKKYKINTDFKIALECDKIARDMSIGEYEKCLAIIYKLLGEEALKDHKHHDKIMKLIMKYLQCGEDEENIDEESTMSFTQDIGYIKASFMSDYNIDLDKEKMSWYRDWETDRKSTRLNSSHSAKSRMPSSA